MRTFIKMGIRELQAQKAEALQMYHDDCARIDAHINAIRKKRGTKLKVYIPTANDARLMNIADGRTRQLNPHGE